MCETEFTEVLSLARRETTGVAVSSQFYKSFVLSLSPVVRNFTRKMCNFIIENI